LADKKITELPASGSSLLDTDVFPFAANVETSPETRKISALSLKYYFSDALSSWYPDSETWVYLSSSAMVITGDFTSIFKRGTKVRWTQSSTVKYGALSIDSTYSAPYTYLNIIVNTDYVVTNNTITNPGYSYASPPDFPSYFNYTTTWGGSVSNPSLGNGTIASRYTINGKMISVFINLNMGSSTNFGSGVYSWTLPATCYQMLMGSAVELDSGNAYHVGTTTLGGSSSVFGAISENGPSMWSNTVPQTWDIADWMQLSVHYLI
jgi:hypothetical protein